MNPFLLLESHLNNIFITEGMIALSSIQKIQIQKQNSNSELTKDQVMAEAAFTHKNFTNINF